jgi:hypothetical protein
MGKHMYQRNSYQEEHMKNFFCRLLVVGGEGDGREDLSDVEVVSLDPDPETNPVPACLEELNSFPTTVKKGAHGLLGSGKPKEEKNISLEHVCTN